MKKLGFRYVKRQGQRCARENMFVACRRANYLREVKKARAQGMQIVYTDETWVNLNHKITKEWSHNHQNVLLDYCKECCYQFPEGKGRRLILVDAGTEEGFVDGAEWLFMSRTGKADYHEEMNGECFQEWWKDRLIPNLTKPSLIIIDNAPYHNIRTPSSIVPTSSSKKQDIINWLEGRGLASADMNKLQLLEKVKLNAPPPRYIIEEIAEEKGHKVLRLPPRHPELNAIELIWAYLKSYVARKNSSGKEGEIRKLLKEAKQSAPLDLWQKVVHHAKEQEQQYWEKEMADDGEVEQMVFTVNDDDSDDDSEDDMNSDNDSQVSNTTEDDNMENLSDNDDDEVCETCKSFVAPKSTGSGQDEWVQCDYCENWHHKVCVKYKGGQSNEPWSCKNCERILSFKYY